MNKASSIYVDQFAVEKLLTEKLSRVSHIPGPPGESGRIMDLDKKFGSLKAADFTTTAAGLTFHSPCKSEYPENNLCPVNIYPAQQEKGRLIFVHGLYEENRTIYQYLFMLLNKRGYTVYLYILPYHYERKPAASLFSGEYFWSASFKRSLAAFRQAVEELYLLYLFLKQRYNTGLSLCGFSMGATVLFNLAAGTALHSKLFLTSPITDINWQIRTSPLWQSIKKDYEQWQVATDVIEKTYAPVSPQSWTSLKTDPRNIMCVCGEYDQLIDSRATMQFFSRFPGVSRQMLKCGHLNMLRIPRLAEDITRFFNTKAARQQAREEK